ncbi:NAD(P)/FAD-dependent oxidoreductase [Pseudonocardia alni]|uniref:Thioredoxin reductase (NADPH) n=1 Tax=Pseudonocardia alni TaxID=33907 RepID=A0AA44UM49_PSEA5|nr:thioredoxin reductase (NADPH) [Pseudonocardia alni]
MQPQRRRLLGSSGSTPTGIDRATPSPAPAPASHSHGFLSRDWMDPAELLSTARREVAGYGGELLEGRAVGIDRLDGIRFAVHLAEGGRLDARAVVVATGLHDELPDIPGLPPRWGQDVHVCPYCHGYEVRDSALGVIGGEDRAFSLRQAQLIRQWSDDVVFFPHRITLDAHERGPLIARGLRIADGEVTRIVSDETGVRGVELAEGPIVTRTALFVGPRFVPSDELLTALGCDLDDEGWVATDRTGRTSINGVWAPGNVVDHTAQLISAAAAGSAAAIALNNQYLIPADVEMAIAGHTEPAPIH